MDDSAYEKYIYSSLRKWFRSSKNPMPPYILFLSPLFSQQKTNLVDSSDACNRVIQILQV